METIFIISLAVIFYTYLGHALLIYLLVKFKKDKEAPTFNKNGFPFESVMVPCFKEGEHLRHKIQNTLDLIYPQELIEYIFICDRSSDGTEQIPAPFSEVKTMFSYRTYKVYGQRIS